VLKDRSYVDQLESSQGQTVPMSISSANGEANPDAERKLEEVAVEQDKVPEVKVETKTEARTS
jgi:hypothetical protein